MAAARVSGPSPGLTGSVCSQRRGQCSSSSPGCVDPPDRPSFARRGPDIETPFHFNCRVNSELCLFRTPKYPSHSRLICWLGQTCRGRISGGPGPVLAAMIAIVAFTVAVRKS
jgi:hypothetical protein